MRRAWAVCVALLVVGVVALDFVPGCAGHWDGGFDLTVRVTRPDGPPRSVSCEAFSQREHAEDARDALLPPEGSYAAGADPFDGRLLTVRVPSGYMYSPLGRVVHRWQFRHLVVIGVLPDGRRVSALVDIPDWRVSREVSVTLP